MQHTHRKFYIQDKKKKLKIVIFLLFSCFKPSETKEQYR
jgi:hypothetical protein